MAEERRNLQVPPAEPNQREIELQMLRTFDLDSRFGPFIGITREERWNEAAQNGLNPPQEIKDILLRNSSDPEYIKHTYKDL